MAGITGKAVTLEVTRQYQKGRRKDPEEVEQETFEILKFESDREVATTSVKLGLTVSPKQYEFVRCDVMCTVPHYVEEAEDAFLYTLGLVEKRLMAAFGDPKAQTELLERARESMSSSGAK